MSQEPTKDNFSIRVLHGVQKTLRGVQKTLEIQRLKRPFLRKERSVHKKKCLQNFFTAKRWRVLLYENKALGGLLGPTSIRRPLEPKGGLQLPFVANGRHQDSLPLLFSRLPKKSLSFLPSQKALALFVKFPFPLNCNIQGYVPEITHTFTQGYLSLPPLQFLLSLSLPL